MRTKKKIMKDLNTIDDGLIKESLKTQKDLGWDFYDEREFMENLFCQRFNYFLIVYSLFITAAASVKNEKSLIIVLSLGIFLTISIWLTLYRAYVKLIINLKILYRIPKKGHVFQVINNEIKTYNWVKRLFGVNSLIGVYIPIFCILTLITALILVLFGCLEPFSL